MSNEPRFIFNPDSSRSYFEQLGDFRQQAEFISDLHAEVKISMPEPIDYSNELREIGYTIEEGFRKKTETRNQRLSELIHST